MQGDKELTDTVRQRRSAAGTGISKAGNGRVRALMIELGWFWLCYQLQSELIESMVCVPLCAWGGHA